MNNFFKQGEVINDWCLLAHPLFVEQVKTLVLKVEELHHKYPTEYRNKNATKRLEAIRYLMFEKIPQDPSLPEYRQGLTLGEAHKHWFRAKFFQQYRLFFRYHEKSKIIVYAWVNDEASKRAYQQKSDAYAVFKKMLDQGNPPNDWISLLKEAKQGAERFQSLFADLKDK